MKMHQAPGTCQEMPSGECGVHREKEHYEAVWSVCKGWGKVEGKDTQSDRVALFRLKDVGGWMIPVGW